MTETAHQRGDVVRLKSLLFRNEQEAIDDIRAQLEAHHERIGSDEVMRDSVSGVLAGALKDARIRQHKQVADAIAPILVEGMKREIKNSRDEMVDALYPIMGRLVSAYVSSAVADVMNQTNQRLESGLSGRFLYLRAKALLTGRSYQELAIADRQMFRIGELMLIRRGSGVLIDHLKLDDDDAAAVPTTSHDSALVSGVVAAIHDFAQDAFSGNKSTLRSVDMGDETIYLRATSGLILAVIGRGKARRKLERALDAELVTLLEERASDIKRLEDEADENTPKILPVVADRLLKIQLEATQRKPVLAILLFGLLGAAIASYAVWSGYNSWQTARLRDAVKSTIAEHAAFDGLPMQVEVASDRSRIQVAGFAPSGSARDDLLEALETVSGPAELSAKLSIVPSLDGFENRLSQAETQVASVTSDLSSARASIDAAATRAALSDLSADLARLQEENQIERVSIAERASALQKRIDALEARKIPQPENPLARWVQRNGLFFAEGTNYRDAGQARKVLRQLAELLRSDPARIRVVGYADARGRPDANRKLAQDRAERTVADLVRAGVSRRKLVAVGRASERQFSIETGPESGNRRVEFELLFDGE